MSTPNQELMGRYGTGDVYAQKLAGRAPLFQRAALRMVQDDQRQAREEWEQGLEERAHREKQASSFAPMAARMALGLLNVQSDQADEGRARALMQQAQEMNQALAHARAMMMMPAEHRMQHTRMPFILRAMHPTNDPEISLGGMGPDLPPAMQGAPRMLRGSDVPLGYDEGMVRMASAMGRAMLHADLEAMAKEAGIGQAIGNVGSALTNAAANLGRRAVSQGTNAIQGAVRNVEQGIAGAANKVSAGVGAAPGRISQGISNKIEGVGARVEGKLNSALGGPGGGALKPPARAPQPAGRVPAPPPAPGAKPPSGGQLNIQQPQPPTEPTTGGVQPPAPTPQAQPAAPAAPAPPPGPAAAGKVGPPGEFNLGDKLQQGWDRSGLSGGAWKWKLPLLAGGALAAHGLVQGAKGLAGMMSQESAPYQFNKGSVTPAAGVNEYGQVDRSTPFTA